MISAHDVIDRIEAAGGVLTLQGDRIRCRLPEDACPLLDELRAGRDEVFALLLGAQVYQRCRRVFECCNGN
jgi:hypothetical protein